MSKNPMDVSLFERMQQLGNTLDVRPHGLDRDIDPRRFQLHFGSNGILTSCIGVYENDVAVEMQRLLESDVQFRRLADKTVLLYAMWNLRDKLGNVKNILETAVNNSLS